MKYNHSIFIFLFLSSVVCCLSAIEKENSINNWIYTNFDEAMQKDSHYKEMALTSRMVGIDAEDLYIFFKNLYIVNNLSVIKPSEKLKIPKIIHQIWLGSELPVEFKSYVSSCIEIHLGNGWSYKLWTDKDIEKLDLYNRYYYDLSTNYGVKSDLLKWEIIYKFGGVYLDTDIECLKSLEILHYTYDFYVGIQPLEAKYLQLGAGIFAARSGHPILKHCIETIKDDWSKKGTVIKTGPVHLTRSFYAAAGRNGNIDIALPPNYFYPIRSAPYFFFTPLASQQERDNWLVNGAYTIHHWSMSWMPPEYRQPTFRTIKNYDSTKTWNN